MLLTIKLNTYQFPGWPSKLKLLKRACAILLSLCCFTLEGTWNFSEPKAVGLGKDPVMAIAVVKENLWCSCGNKLVIIGHDEEVIKVGTLFNLLSYSGFKR